jgi:acyl carrier protein
VKTTSGKVSRSDNLTKLLATMPDGQSVSGDDVIADDDVTPGDVATIVTRLIATTFDIPASTIRADTVAADVEGWDSLGHTVLMIRLSRALGAVIPEHVPAQASDVGELIELLRPYAVVQ